MLLLLLSLLVADTSRTVRIAVDNGQVLSVTLRGTGPAVVMIPGIFGSSFSYRRVAAGLDEAGYHTVAIEPLGMGSSGRPPEADYSLTAQAERMVTVLDSLGVSRAIFVGHSIGASIAMRVAYRHPDRVSGIVSIEGGPGETAATDGFRRWVKLAPALRMAGAYRGIPALLRREMRKVSHNKDWIDRNVMAGYTNGLMRDFRATIDGYQGMARAEEPEPLEANLHRIAVPVVLLVGDKRHDSGPSEDEVARLTEHLSVFRVDTVPESGYFIQEEQPGTVVEEILAVGTGTLPTGR